MRLTNAILLYQGNWQDSAGFCSVHPVQETPNGPVIGSGHPASKSAILGLVQDLLPRNKQDQLEIIPANLLCKGAGFMAWYCKPQFRQLWFNNPKLGGQVTANVPHPGIVFIVTQRQWYVFAVAGDERPEANTELHVAPYFNVWDGGRICTGNVDVPKGKMKWNSKAWEEAFFRSNFTHPNIHEKNRLLRYAAGPIAFWRMMLEGKKKQFPQKALVATGKTLAQTLQSILKKEVS